MIDTPALQYGAHGVRSPLDAADVVAALRQVGGEGVGGRCGRSATAERLAADPAAEQRFHVSAVSEEVSFRVTRRMRMLRRLATIALPAAALLLVFLVREARRPASERRPVRQSDVARW